MKDTVVVDTSIAIKWVLYESDSPTAQALLAEWIDKGMEILAPALLAYEITNSLYQKVRRGEITLESARIAITKTLTTGLEFDFFQDEILSLRAIELAHRYSLPATYDSHYLALAEREDCPLWTADTRMWRAVKDRLDWVHWMGDYPTPQDKEI
jgi:predicted nucleic acid-binding protein